MMRLPSCASLPPISARAVERRQGSAPRSSSATSAPPLAKPAAPPELGGAGLPSHQAGHQEQHPGRDEKQPETESRVAEIERLAEPFIGAVKRYSEHVDQLTLVAPMVNDAIRDCFSQKQKQLAPALDWRLLDGQAGLAMEAADLVLTASGTATLQALLYKRPMVVGYKLNPLTYKLLTFFRRIRIPYVAMANLLADEELASEYIQDECTPEALALGMENLLTDPPRVALITRRYHEIHKQLQRDAAKRSAREVLRLIAGQ